MAASSGRFKAYNQMRSAAMSAAHDTKSYQRLKASLRSKSPPPLPKQHNGPFPF